MSLPQVTTKTCIFNDFIIRHFSVFFFSGNGNVGVVATDSSFMHIALIQPSMKWLKLPFFPIVTAKASNVPKPRGTCTVHIHAFLHERLH